MTATSAAPRLPLRQMFPAPARPDVASQLRLAAQRTGASFRQLSAHEFGFEVATRPARTQVVYLAIDDSGRSADLRSRVGRFQRFTARDLLTRNAESAIGTLCIEDIDGPSGMRPHVLVKTRVDLHRGSTVLEQSIMMMAWEADELERDLFGHDVE